MKAILLKNKPSDQTDEEWVEHWARVRNYSLTPLVATINQLTAGLNDVKEDDFETPNHYAKLAFRAGQRRMAEQILEIIGS